MSLVTKLAQRGEQEHHDVPGLQQHAAHDVAPQDRVAEQVDERQPVPRRQVGAQDVGGVQGQQQGRRRSARASVPIAAASGDATIVDRNSATDATPSIDSIA